ncbi:MAG: class I mannose-6-phosphate isomerase [Acidobacteriales bacterium]|nr:class I mannose-6-phosphate isomerase [Terriglobales bacterium]
MPDLYPLLPLPQFVERVWGARDLTPVYDFRPSASQQPIGEVWLTGDDCRVANGAFAGRTLAELSLELGQELVGEAATPQNRFPLLVKFLFPQQKLSVQVHPDDNAARQVGEPCGKTECWYVVSAALGAQIGLGLKPGTTREQFQRAIEETRAEALMNWVTLKAGDMFYADAGTVHSIGPGAVIVETQQNSDTTYRLYDYGRGRELHVQKGLAVMKENTHAGKVVRNGFTPEGNDWGMRLINSPCFEVSKSRLHAGQEQVITRHLPPSSVQVLVALDGCGTVGVKGLEPVTFSRGQAIVVPAALEKFAVSSQQQLEYMLMRLPQGETEHPETTVE